MKKLLYSSLLLVGLVASYEVSATNSTSKIEVSKKEVVSLLDKVTRGMKDVSNWSAYDAETVGRLANSARAANLGEKYKQEAMEQLMKLRASLQSPGGEHYTSKQLEVIYKNLRDLHSNIKESRES